MQVSFTGINNAGGAIFEGINKIVVEFTDEGTKDLSEFREILKKYPTNYKLSNKNILQFDSVHFGPDLGNKRRFLINDWSIDLTDANAYIFSKMAALTKRLQESKEKIFVSKDYIESTECVNRYRGFVTEDRITAEENELMNKAHNPEQMKNVAGLINTDISKAMCELYDVNYAEMLGTPLKQTHTVLNN